MKVAFGRVGEKRRKVPKKIAPVKAICVGGLRFENAVIKVKIELHTRHLNGIHGNFGIEVAINDTIL